MAGHYTFSLPEFALLKERASRELANFSIHLDDYLTESVSQSILRYVRFFNLI